MVTHHSSIHDVRWGENSNQDWESEDCFTVKRQAVRPWSFYWIYCEYCELWLYKREILRKTLPGLLTKVSDRIVFTLGVWQMSLHQIALLMCYCDYLNAVSSSKWVGIIFVYCNITNVLLYNQFKHLFAWNASTYVSQYFWICKLKNCINYARTTTSFFTVFYVIVHLFICQECLFNSAR